ncbi:MAG TPA: N-acyl homoserine lactonase family protein [Vicinamibacterales bacterium]|nr:N-acyl homoserine lactonase family protein [Vicinamibacterales bacterium]
MSIKRAGVAAAFALTLAVGSHAQSKPAPPKSVRLYIFDCGVIKGLGVELFGFKPGEVPVRDFFVPCYLVVHPRGTMMWDVGVIADSAFKADGAPVTDGRSTVNKPLLPQLAAVGYTPADITYLGLSHYHSDHTANANAFAGSTWLVRLTERDMMFNPPQGAIVQTASFSALKTAKTRILNDDEYDVFGDGSVVIKSAPGHTPGHQVLFLNLKKFGPLVVAGDLYHYPEERTMNRFPSFEFNKEQSAKSRADLDAFLKAKKAQMWLEHDAATNATLKKAPEYYE